MKVDIDLRETKELTRVQSFFLPKKLIIKSDASLKWLSPDYRDLLFLIWDPSIIEKL